MENEEEGQEEVKVAALAKVKKISRRKKILKKSK